MRLFLCGDVMTGRGIDQALPHPASPVLDEPCIRDARVYVDLAEKANGPIPRPASFGYIWGAALQELERVDLRIINLETGITPNGTPWPGKTRAGLSSDFFVIRHSSRCPRLAHGESVRRPTRLNAAPSVLNTWGNRRSTRHAAI